MWVVVVEKKTVKCSEREREREREKERERRAALRYTHDAQDITSKLLAGTCQ